MVSFEGSLWHRTNRGVAVAGTTYILLFVIVIILSKFRTLYPKFGGFVPETGLMFLIGVIAGRFIYSVSDEGDSVLLLSPSTVLYVLLPPILLNQAYNGVHRGMFSRYIVPICIYGVLGTVFSAVSLATLLFLGSTMFDIFTQRNPYFMELLAFTSLLSATGNIGPTLLSTLRKRRVDPHLFHLVAGESLISSLTAIILYEACVNLHYSATEHYLSATQQLHQFLFDIVVTGFLGPAVLALIWNFGVLYLLKRIAFPREESSRWELSLYLLLTMYAPFLVGECIRVNGLCTIIFSGLVLRRYDVLLTTMPAEIKRTANTLLRRMAQYAETLLYLEMGATIFVYGESFRFMFVVLTLGGIVLGRAFAILPTTFSYNLAVEDDQQLLDGVEKADSMVEHKVLKNDTLIPVKTSRMVYYANIKGTLAYGLVKFFPGNQYNTHNTVFILTTILCIVFTTFTIGTEYVTNFVLSILDIPVNIDEDMYIERMKKRQDEEIKKQQVLGISGWHKLERFMIIKPLHYAMQQAAAENTDDGDMSNIKNNNTHHTDDENNNYYIRGNQNSWDTSVDAFYFENDFRNGDSDWEQEESTLYDYGQ